MLRSKTRPILAAHVGFLAAEEVIPEVYGLLVELWGGASESDVRLFLFA
jgi:hypothetical protein